MAILTCKHSVRFRDFTPAMLHLLTRSAACAEQTGEVAEVVITSANDSQHGPKSRHYTDEALDFRVHNFPSQAAIKRFRSRLEQWLGPQFRVLYEGSGTPNAHLHAQVRKGHVYDRGLESL